MLADHEIDWLVGALVGTAEAIQEKTNRSRVWTTIMELHRNGQLHETMFERDFGARPDANVQRKQRDKRPRLVRSHW